MYQVVVKYSDVSDKCTISIFRKIELFWVDTEVNKSKRIVSQ